MNSLNIKSGIWKRTLKKQTKLVYRQEQSCYWRKAASSKIESFLKMCLKTTSRLSPQMRPPLTYVLLKIHLSFPRLGDAMENVSTLLKDAKADSRYYMWTGLYWIERSSLVKVFQKTYLFRVLSVALLLLMKL